MHLSARLVPGVAEDGDALEQGLADDGFHHVELQLSGFGGKGNGGVVADDFEADLVDHFGYHGVDFGGHDGRAGLHFGQVDFVQAGAGGRRRAGAGRLQILESLTARRFEGGVHADVCAAVGGGFDEVGRGACRAGR